jgi:putative transposase
MGRIRRPYLPGCAFHLTARVQHREHRFIPVLRTEIVRLLRRNVARSDARLLAYVIMSNHLHLVVVQGDQPLSDLMQPFLRSVALATHDIFGTEGHVFERRFTDRICRDEDHLRNAIAYTHANPVRAGMCVDPAEYAWSSHRRYLNLRALVPAPRVEVVAGLRAFVPGGTVRGRTARASARYRELVGMAGRNEDLGPEDVSVTEAPQGTPGLESSATIRSLEEIAGHLLTAQGAPASIDGVRTRWGSRSRLAIRDHIAVEASRAGYSGGAIARFLKISPATVSRILAAPRRADLPDLPLQIA